MQRGLIELTVQKILWVSQAEGLADQQFLLAAHSEGCAANFGATFSQVLLVFTTDTDWKGKLVASLSKIQVTLTTTRTSCGTRISDNAVRK